MCRILQACSTMMNAKLEYNGCFSKIINPSTKHLIGVLLGNVCVACNTNILCKCGIQSNLWFNSFLPNKTSSTQYPMCTRKTMANAAQPYQETRLYNRTFLNGNWEQAWVWVLAHFSVNSSNHNIWLCSFLLLMFHGKHNVLATLTTWKSTGWMPIWKHLYKWAVIAFKDFVHRSTTSDPTIYRSSAHDRPVAERSP